MTGNDAQEMPQYSVEMLEEEMDCYAEETDTNTQSLIRAHERDHTTQHISHTYFSQDGDENSSVTSTSDSHVTNMTLMSGSTSANSLMSPTFSLDSIARMEKGETEYGEQAMGQEEQQQQQQLLPRRRTPLPWKKLVIVFTCHLTDTYSFTTLLPYIAFLTSSFQLTEVDCEGGDIDSSDPRCASLYFYAGFIASSYYVGQFLSCLFWGWASDRVSSYGCCSLFCGLVLATCATYILITNAWDSSDESPSFSSES